MSGNLKLNERLATGRTGNGDRKSELCVWCWRRNKEKKEIHGSSDISKTYTKRIHWTMGSGA
ncbi:hypothetical protein CHS0354_026141, partial [Potamilus streckersoni]